jgi:hypothetical protein
MVYCVGLVLVWITTRLPPLKEKIQSPNIFLGLYKDILLYFFVFSLSLSLDLFINKKGFKKRISLGLSLALVM